MFYFKLQMELLKPLYRGFYVAFWIGKNPRHLFHIRLFRFIPSKKGHFYCDHWIYHPEE